MVSTAKRIFQRYAFPQFAAAIYYSLRHLCLVSIHARVQLSGSIVLGKGTVVKPYAIIQTQGGTIRIGRQCAISSFDHISTGIKEVILGDYVRLGPHVTILGGSRIFKKKSVRIVEQGSYHKAVYIGNDVLVGAGTVILPGCSIGEGAVIGAMSLVNRDVAPYKIVAGVPARVIGERE